MVAYSPWHMCHRPRLSLNTPPPTSSLYICPIYCDMRVCSKAFTHHRRDRLFCICVSCIMHSVTLWCTSRLYCWYLWIHRGSLFDIPEPALALMSVSVSQTGGVAKYWSDCSDCRSSTQKTADTAGSVTRLLWLPSTGAVVKGLVIRMESSATCKQQRRHELYIPCVLMSYKIYTFL